MITRDDFTELSCRQHNRAFSFYNVDGVKVCETKLKYSLNITDVRNRQTPETIVEKNSQLLAVANQKKEETSTHPEKGRQKLFIRRL